LTSPNSFTSGIGNTAIEQHSSPIGVANLKSLRAAQPIGSADKWAMVIAASADRPLRVAGLIEGVLGSTARDREVSAAGRAEGKWSEIPAVVRQSSACAGGQ
jgi:hypothetical protein